MYRLGYFAHSKREYNKPKETLEYDFICKLFYGFIICPNKHININKDMQPYLDIVGKVDVVFVSEYLDCVGKGVYQECEKALSLNIPIYLVKQDKKGLYLLKINSIEKLDNCNYALFGKLICDETKILQSEFVKPK